MFKAVFAGHWGLWSASHSAVKVMQVVEMSVWTWSGSLLLVFPPDPSQSIKANHHFTIIWLECVMPRNVPAGNFTNQFPVPVNVYLFIKPLVSFFFCFIFLGVKLEGDREMHAHSHMFKIIECHYHWTITDNHFLTCTGHGMRDHNVLPRCSVGVAVCTWLFLR